MTDPFLAALRATTPPHDDVLTDAEYWQFLCRQRVGRGASLVDFKWCRVLLEEAAEETLTTGYCGRMWRFPDGSLLISNQDYEVVR